MKSAVRGGGTFEVNAPLLRVDDVEKLGLKDPKKFNFTHFTKSATPPEKVPLVFFFGVQQDLALFKFSLV